MRFLFSFQFFFLIIFLISYRAARIAGLWHCGVCAATACIRSDKRDECRRDEVDYSDYFRVTMATLELRHYAMMS